ncbi:alginate O-acetyltransferase AlgX-related protein [uncultured Clostridium sp.]|uniref:alginate O-acetyltransferase AlgX-related protein n=1 Tax=uncultured Clostridium sp. TaxID=59620 RepID=UPI0026082150|nr:hypothetical protein [uncultured Clostridium sp.]
MNKKQNLLVITPFLALTFLITVVNLIMPDSKSSTFENRNLMQLSEISGDFKEFTSKFEEYYSDQFIQRDLFIKNDKKKQLASAKSRIDGTNITEDGFLIKDIYKLNDEHIKTQSQKLNLLGEELKKDGTKLILTSTPSHSNILQFKVSDMDYLNTKTDVSLDVYADNLDSDNVSFINLDKYFKDTFSKDELSDFYFKTDHHWNMSGGFEGFKYIIDFLNENHDLSVELPLDDYKKILLEDKSFNGSRNMNLYYLFSRLEDIHFVYNKNHNKDLKITIYKDDTGLIDLKPEDVYASELESKNLTYTGIYAHGVPYRHIKNSKSLTDKKIVILRDSFVSAMEWLFTDIFAEVIILDSRYIDEPIMPIIKQIKPDYLMPTFNSSSITTMVSGMLKE